MRHARGRAGLSDLAIPVVRQSATSLELACRDRTGCRPRPYSVGSCLHYLAAGLPRLVRSTRTAGSVAPVVTSELVSAASSRKSAMAQRRFGVRKRDGACLVRVKVSRTSSRRSRVFLDVRQIRLAPSRLRVHETGATARSCPARRANDCDRPGSAASSRSRTRCERVRG